MGLYSAYKTNDNLEKNGIRLDYGDFVITVRRAGGSNREYEQEMRKNFQKFNLANRKSVSEKVNLEMLNAWYIVFARTVVVNWETLKDDEFVQGIEAEDGSIIEFNEENVIKTFKNLPELFNDVQMQASNMQLFLDQNIEDAAKN